MPLQAHRNANAAPVRSRRSRPQNSGTEEIVGRLMTLDPISERIEVEDERTGRRIWFELTQTRMRNVGDGDGDGRRSVTDLFPGDRVRILAERGTRTPRRARSLRKLGPQGPVGGLRRLAA